MTNIFDRYADPESLSRVFLEMYISAAKYRKSIQPQYIKIPIIIETNMHFWFFVTLNMKHPFFTSDVLLNLYWIHYNHYNLNCSSAIVQRISWSRLHSPAKHNEKFKLNQLNYNKDIQRISTFVFPGPYSKEVNFDTLVNWLFTKL